MYKACDNIDLRYSFNATASTVPTGSKVFVKGEIRDDGLFYLADDWLATSLPAEEDGKVYIFLGITHGSRWQFLEFWSEHPVVQFKDGRIQRLY